MNHGTCKQWKNSVPKTLDSARFIQIPTSRPSSLPKPPHLTIYIPSADLPRGGIGTKLTRESLPQLSIHPRARRRDQYRQNPVEVSSPSPTPNCNRPNECELYVFTPARRSPSPFRSQELGSRHTPGELVMSECGESVKVPIEYLEASSRGWGT